MRAFAAIFYGTAIGLSMAALDPWGTGEFFCYPLGFFFAFFLVNSTREPPSGRRQTTT